MPFTTRVLESFRPGSNPFHYDAISCGAKLGDIVPLDPRFDHEMMDMFIMYGGRLRNGLYIVNTKTGERLRIDYEFPSDA